MIAIHATMELIFNGTDDGLEINAKGPSTLELFVDGKGPYNVPTLLDWSNVGVNTTIELRHDTNKLMRMVPYSCYGIEREHYSEQFERVAPRWQGARTGRYRSAFTTPTGGGHTMHDDAMDALRAAAMFDHQKTMDELIDKMLRGAVWQSP